MPQMHTYQVTVRDENGVDSTVGARMDLSASTDSGGSGGGSGGASSSPSSSPGGPDAAHALALLRAWQDNGEKIVVLRGEGAAHLEALRDQAERRRLLACTTRDAGRTQVEPGSLTVLAVGPGLEEAIDDVTGHLKLL